MSTRIDHWIDGARVAGTSGRTAPVHNPATGEVTGRVALASAEEVRTAVASASEAAREWRSSSLSQRAAVLFAFRELLHARSDDLAEVVTAEHGKVLADAAGEVARGLENRRVRHLPLARPRHLRSQPRLPPDQVGLGQVIAGACSTITTCA